MRAGSSVMAAGGVPGPVKALKLGGGSSWMAKGGKKMGGFGGGWLEQLCEAVARRVVGRPLPGSAELPGAARRPEEAQEPRWGAAKGAL